MKNKKLLIVKSRSFLASFLQKTEKTEREKWRFVPLDRSTDNCISILEAHGVQRLPLRSFTSHEQERYLDEYLGVVGRLAECNGQNLLWWATDISSKNRYTSPLPALLLKVAQLLQAIDASTEEGEVIILVSPPWPVVIFLHRYAASENLKLQLLAWPWTGLVSRLRGKVRIWTRLIMETLAICCRIVQTRIFYGLKPPALDKPVYLIKSFVYEKSFTADGGYHDPFFGRLSAFVRSSMKGTGEVVTVAVSFSRRSWTFRQMRAMTSEHLVPLESFISLKDVLVVSWRLAFNILFKPFRTNSEIRFLAKDIAPLISECLRGGGGQLSLFHVLHQNAAQRIARAYDLVAGTFTFEGNPWERMFTAGLLEVNPGLPIYGYQHSIVPQSAAGVFVTKAEQTSGLPLPGKILTTGQTTQQIIRQFGDLAPNICLAACALRYEYLHRIPPLARHNSKEMEVLVALEGVDDAALLLSYALQQANLCPTVSFCIRPHPVTPVKRLLHSLNWTAALPSNVVVSQNSKVLDDVTSCDAVLYWGTTVALEAVFAGKPAIHLNTTSLLNNDPLYTLDDFKWTVSPEEELLPILIKINSLSDEKYGMLRESARKFIPQYFYPVNDEKLSLFLTDVHCRKRRGDEQVNVVSGCHQDISHKRPQNYEDNLFI